MIAPSAQASQSQPTTAAASSAEQPSSAWQHSEWSEPRNEWARAAAGNPVTAPVWLDGSELADAIQTDPGNRAPATPGPAPARPTAALTEAPKPAPLPDYSGEEADTVIAPPMHAQSPDDLQLEDDWLEEDPRTEVISGLASTPVDQSIYGAEDLHEVVVDPSYVALLHGTLDPAQARAIGPVAVEPDLSSTLTLGFVVGFAVATLAGVMLAVAAVLSALVWLG